MEMMKLTGFRVTNFRSVRDSGWIDVDNVTALVGTNESGKTNLLIPLWKLKPANDERVNPIPDFPRKRYSDIRDMEQKPIFIEARFDLPDELAEQIANLTGATEQDVRTAIVKRDLANKYYVNFPEAPTIRHIDKKELADLLEAAICEIKDLTASKTEEELKSLILSTLETLQKEVSDIAEENIQRDVLERIQEKLNKIDTENVPKRSIIVPRFLQLKDEIGEFFVFVTTPTPNDNVDARRKVFENIPSFVYYSNYGNLDSEIYLPHVIENMQRTDLGSKEEAKARTLNVLFNFVKLKPEEILALGQDANPNLGRPTDEMIEQIGQQKKEREILLQSASSSLTEKFRSWWKQGEYRFRFQADGNHFRIWVSDDKRPEEIELEGRSTGLQWFLSFYLTFLVESAKAHKGSILLLDEPGLSLHALAQQDLSVFFDGLSQNNQLLYTTHSPFLVDPDHLDRVKAVYIDEQGATVVSANLRASEGSIAQSRSIYPVHAALGLSISSTLMQGCLSVVVEGQSDQIYLSFIKNYLISKGLITPKRELLFIPAGGVRGISAIVAILTGKDEALPFVIVDSDRPGQDTMNKLKAGLYQGAVDRIVTASDMCGLVNAEVEDLLPTKFLADAITRYLRTLSRQEEDEFSDLVEDNKPLIPQVEVYAKKHNILLELGWKVEVAKKAKIQFLKSQDPMKDYLNIVNMWKSLFVKITS